MNLTFLVTLVLVFAGSIVVVYYIFFRPAKKEVPKRVEEPAEPAKKPQPKPKPSRRRGAGASSAPKRESLETNARHVVAVTPPGSKIPVIDFCVNKRLLLLIRADDEHLYAYRTSDLSDASSSVPLLHVHNFQHGDTEDYPTTLASSFLAPNATVSICALALDDSPPGQVIQILRVTNATGAIRKGNTVTCSRRFGPGEPISFLHLCRSNGQLLAASSSGKSDTVFMFASDGELLREFRTGMLAVNPVSVSSDSVWLCAGASGSGMFERQVRVWGFSYRKDQSRSKKILGKDLVQYLSLDLDREVVAFCFVHRRPKLILVATKEGLVMIMLKKMKASGQRQTGGKGGVVWFQPYSALGLSVDQLNVSAIAAHSFSRTGKKRTMVEEGANQDIVGVLSINKGQSLVCFRCGEVENDGARELFQLVLPTYAIGSRRGSRNRPDRVRHLRIGPRGRVCMVALDSGKFHLLDISDPESEEEAEGGGGGGAGFRSQRKKQRRRRARKRKRGGRA